MCIGLHIGVQVLIYCLRSFFVFKFLTSIQTYPVPEPLPTYHILHPSLSLGREIVRLWYCLYHHSLDKAYICLFWFEYHKIAFIIITFPTSIQISHSPAPIFLLISPYQCFAFFIDSFFIHQWSWHSWFLILTHHLPTYPVHQSLPTFTILHVLVLVAFVVYLVWGNMLIHIYMFWFDYYYYY